MGSFGGQTYPNSVIIPIQETSSKTVFDLCGRYQTFTATLGYDKDANVSVKITAGSKDVLFEGDNYGPLGPSNGTGVLVHASIAGAQTLTLYVSEECCVRMNVVFGSAQVS